jgi:hypothetical protein
LSLTAVNTKRFRSRLAPIGASSAGFYGGLAKRDDVPATDGWVTRQGSRDEFAGFIRQIELLQDFQCSMRFAQGGQFPWLKALFASGARYIFHTIENCVLGQFDAMWHLANVDLK